MKPNTISTFIKNALIDIILFAALFGFVYLIRQLIINALTKLQELLPQLSVLEQALQQSQSQESLQALQNILTEVNRTTQFALFLGVVLLPLGIYLLFTLAQTFHYHILSKTKLSLKSFGKYLLFTLPFMIILILMFGRVLSLIAPLRENFTPAPQQAVLEILAYIIITLLMLIYVHAAYSMLPTTTLRASYMHTLRRIFRKWYVTIPLGILIGIAYAFIIYFLFSTYLSITQTGHLLQALLGTIISIIILAFLRTIFHSLLTRKYQENNK